MNWVFLSVVIGVIISLLLTPLFIRFQKRKAIGQKIRVDGPQSHSLKAGTPTMGGVVFILASTISFLAVILVKYYRYGDLSREGLFILSIFIRYLSLLMMTMTNQHKTGV